MKRKLWKGLSQEEQLRIGNEWKRQVLKMGEIDKKRASYYGVKF